MKFVCIGDYDTVMGFRFAGVDGVVVESPSEARRELDRALAAADVGVIILPDQISAELQQEINQVRFTRTRPAIVEIAGPDGRRAGRPRLVDLIREAIGVRV
ncbi:MAG TPA: V-type ATP synthase subunit F [Phycisphaerae bacterium]|nr:V-type ATP synthase subunit F [Phycisphaerae bacterium]